MMNTIVQQCSAFFIVLLALYFTMKKLHLKPNVGCKEMKKVFHQLTLHSLLPDLPNVIWNVCYSLEMSEQCHQSWMLGNNYTTWVAGWALTLVGLKETIRGFLYSLFVLYFILIQLDDLVFDVKIEFFGAVVIIQSSSRTLLSHC